MTAKKVDVKAAALHAFALVLGPPKNSASPPAAAATSSARVVTGGGGHNNDDGDGDEMMGNTAAAEASAAATEEGRGREKSLLCRLMFERLGMCNNPQPAGALLLDLARQPVPEVKPILFSPHILTQLFRCFVLLRLLLLQQPQRLPVLSTRRYWKDFIIDGSTDPLYVITIFSYSRERAGWMAGWLASLCRVLTLPICVAVFGMWSVACTTKKTTSSPFCMPPLHTPAPGVCPYVLGVAIVRKLNPNPTSGSTCCARRFAVHGVAAGRVGAAGGVQPARLPGFSRGTGCSVVEGSTCMHRATAVTRMFFPSYPVLFQVQFHPHPGVSLPLPLLYAALFVCSSYFLAFASFLLQTWARAQLPPWCFSDRA